MQRNSLSDEPRNRLIFDLISKHLSDELDRYRSLDNKAAIISSSDGIMLAFLVGIQTLLPNHPMSPAILLTFAVSAGLLFSSLCIAFISFRVSKIEWAPDAKTIATDYASATLHNILADSGAEMLRSIPEIEATNFTKAQRIASAWLLMLFGVLAMLIYTIVIVYVAG